MLFDFVLFKVVDVGLDCLPLGEDAMGKDWVSFCEKPIAFFGSAVPEIGFVDRDDRWVFVLEVLVHVVGIDCEACFVGLGVELLEC